MFSYSSFKKYMVNALTAAAVCTPIFAGLEVLAADMSNETSWNARLVSLGVIVAGGAERFTNGLERSREQTVGATATNRDLLKHDAVYSARFNLVTSPFFYFACGSRSVSEIAIGTIVVTVLGYILGGRYGYILDTAHDLTGVQPTERTHPLLKDKSARAKKTIAAMGVTASAAATALIYHINR